MAYDLNLVYYEKLYREQYNLALEVANMCIEAMGRRPLDMPRENITSVTVRGIEYYKGYYHNVCVMVGSMLFSSGYWHTFIIRKENTGLYKVVHDIAMMTDSEKKANVEITSPEQTLRSRMIHAPVRSPLDQHGSSDHQPDQD